MKHPCDDALLHELNAFSMGMTLTATLFVAVMAITSCVHHGRITCTDGSGAKVTVTQPDKAVHPATLEHGPMIISTGSGQKQTPAMIAADQTWIAWVTGPALMIGGVGVLAARSYLPLIPTTAGTYTIAIGAAVMALAIGLPALPTWVWIVAVIGLGLWLIVPGVISNYHSSPRNSWNSNSPLKGHA
ncbi:hypothetical protein [Mucisphaera calidilacus]|uniref:Uncharacterized protein n=1 Tax=Mucisphaera calidilacus TaxID=2527982 RepID=A0A518BVR3_9BACT|nr:hypothetical protein [Mucisphaera calidilacus]QDU71037.1 hypothetical protein Pan265_08820 [Mucisphaera calidilacus]